MPYHVATTFVLAPADLWRALAVRVKAVHCVVGDDIDTVFSHGEAILDFLTLQSILECRRGGVGHVLGQAGSANRDRCDELLSNFQFAVIMHRVGTRLTALGIFPPEAEFDINNNCTLLIDEQIAKFGLGQQ